jgi:hypothetical protein
MRALRILTWRTSLRILLAITLWAASASLASADNLSRGAAAFHRADYARAFRELSPLAGQENAKALGLLGFMYEHGFGVPQAYNIAADLYRRAADQGDSFAQAMLGLMYDKGQGVPNDFVLAYKWLNLASAGARGRERETYVALRNAVASKLSSNEASAGRRLAFSWTPARREMEMRPRQKQ